MSKYGTAFLSWKADGTADMDRPLDLPKPAPRNPGKMADGGRVNLAVGFPYGIYNSKMVDGGIIKSKWWMTGLNAMPNLPAPYNPGPGTPFYMSGNRNTISGAGGY